MEEEMFCYQCQETCRNTGCTMVGMCGKKPETARLMDQLLRQLKLIALSGKNDPQLGRFVIRSLFMTVTNTNFDNAVLQEQLDRAIALTGNSAFDLPAGVLSCEDQNVRSLRELLTSPGMSRKRSPSCWRCFLSGSGISVSDRHCLRFCLRLSPQD